MASNLNWSKVEVVLFWLLGKWHGPQIRGAMHSKSLLFLTYWTRKSKCQREGQRINDAKGS